MAPYNSPYGGGYQAPQRMNPAGGYSMNRSNPSGSMFGPRMDPNNGYRPFPQQSQQRRPPPFMPSGAGGGSFMQPQQKQGGGLMRSIGGAFGGMFGGGQKPQMNQGGFGSALGQAGQMGGPYGQMKPPMGSAPGGIQMNRPFGGGPPPPGRGPEDYMGGTGYNTRWKNQQPPMGQTSSPYEAWKQMQRPGNYTNYMTGQPIGQLQPAVPGGTEGFNQQINPQTGEGLTGNLNPERDMNQGGIGPSQLPPEFMNGGGYGVQGGNANNRALWGPGGEWRGR